MSKHRIPVPGATLHEMLQCTDPVSDEVIDPECLKRRESLPITPGRYACPRGCRKGTWLFPRYRREESVDSTHYHQGMDIGGGVAGVHEGEVPILSVTSGEVVKAQHDDVGTYGRMVVIRDDENRYFLYAHCHRIEMGLAPLVRVAEKQLLGTVGSSGNAKASAPHLHFEVSKTELPTKAGAAFETKPGVPPTARINPKKVLEELGPWGMTQAWYPTGAKVTSVEAESLHDEIENSAGGGFFPLGANNLWHGGVHLSMPAGSVIKAPIDGRIVAMRLDPDPARHRGAYGSANFILIEHEIDSAVFDEMQSPPSSPGEAPKTRPETPKKRGVGKHTTNDPALVLEAKRRLHALGHYKPDPPALLDDPTITTKGDSFIEALEA